MAVKTISLQFKKRNKSARRWGMLAFCAVLAGSVWSASALTSATAATSLHTVKLLEDAGFTGDTPIWVAQEEGFFKKNGINATLVPSTGVADLPHMYAGAADIDLAPPTLAVAAAASGDQLSILGTIVHSYDQQLVGKVTSLPKAAKPGQFPQVIRALKGQNVCINAAGGSNDVMFRFLLHEAGMSASSVHIDYAGSLQTVVTAMESGRCTVAHVPQPGPLELTSQPGFKILLNLAKGQGPAVVRQPFLTVIVRKSWAAENPQLAQGVVKSLDEAVAFMTQPTNRGTVTAIMKKDVLQGLKPSLIPGIVSDMLSTLSAKSADLAFTAADLKKAEELVAATGLTKTPAAAKIPASQLIPNLAAK